MARHSLIDCSDHIFPRLLVEQQGNTLGYLYYTYAAKTYQKRRVSEKVTCPDSPPTFMELEMSVSMRAWS